jgi:hypothetical protein
MVTTRGIVFVHYVSPPPLLQVSFPSSGGIITRQMGHVGLELNVPATDRKEIG